MITIRTVKNTRLEEMLQLHNYNCEDVTEKVLRISRADFEVFVHHEAGTLYFETPVGELSEIKSMALYEDLLDLNTEVLPVSVGLDKSQVNKLRLVIVESRELSDLDENELLSVLQALEITFAKVEVLLAKHIENE